MRIIRQLRIAISSILVLLCSAACDVCENQVVSIAPSPNGLVRAFLFTRSCGATTGFSTQISIIPSDAKLPNERGNTFIADSDHGRVPIENNGELKVRMTWLSNDQLLVEYPKGARLFRSENTRRRIHIEYRTDIP